MAIYVVTPKSGLIKAAAERSPRLAIVTDAASPERLPTEVLAAGDAIQTEDLKPLGNAQVPGEMDGAVVWLEGDNLLRGSAADLRRAFLHQPPRSFFVPVHLPCLPEADLLGIQPRLLAAGASELRVSSAIRIAGATSLSAHALTTLKGIEQPWARLHLALLREHKQPGTGLEHLKQLWQKGNLEPLVASLLLRDLIVALMRRKEFAKAEELLTLGGQAYPGYAELPFLAALLCLYRQTPSKAIRHLDQAMRLTTHGFVGSGGESSYRAAWMMGTICNLTGEQQKAVSYFLPGIYQRPAFAPSVQGLLSLRLPRDRAAQLHQPLCEMVRREPPYLEGVFDFFLKHRVFDPPRRLLRTLPLEEEDREVLQRRLDSVEAPYRSHSTAPLNKIGVILSGPFFNHSGHARINREIGRALVEARELDAGLEPYGYPTLAPHMIPGSEAIVHGLECHPQRVDVFIRHQWPPDFHRPPTGKLACIVPWEHTAVPQKWVEEIQSNVDELWVPSRFVASAFIRGGVDADRVQVLPNGVATDVFHPGVNSWRPAQCRNFVFLFVGGAIRRKGLDILLQAYGDAFSPDDDVTLLVKDIGSKSYYAHNNLLPLVVESARRSHFPHVLSLSDELDDVLLASLYRGCDAFVLPYRGEGFGLPLAEAMACGKPVVTTAQGPAAEFCTEQTAYLIPARESAVPEPPPPFGELTGDWTWYEPDLSALAQTLRLVYEERAEAARRGARAAEAIRANYTWTRISALYRERICQLGSGHMVHSMSGAERVSAGSDR